MAVAHFRVGVAGFELENYRPPCGRLAGAPASPGSRPPARTGRGARGAARGRGGSSARGPEAARARAGGMVMLKINK